MVINNRIINLLYINKITQKELAASIEVAPATLNNWLKMGRSIPAEYIIPICDFFKISPNYLLTGNEQGQQTEGLSDILSNDEKEIMQGYRQLPPAAKESIQHQIHLHTNLYKK